MSGRPQFDRNGFLIAVTDVTGMMFPVRCTKCSHVYDMGKVTVLQRYLDCSIWKCPGCGISVDDRPPGWGMHYYVELDREGRKVR